MSKRVFEIRFLEEDEFSAWDRLVSSSPEGSPYNTSRYLDTLCSAAGGCFRIVAALKGKELSGGAALYETKSRYGSVVAPRLLLYYNGIVLAESPTVNPARRLSNRLATLDVLEEFLSGAGYAKIQLRNRSPLHDMRVFASRGWSISPSYTFVVPLSDERSLWLRIEQNLRRLIDRCREAGVELSEDDDFDSFYRLHQQTHTRKGAPLYLEYRAFRDYFERLKTRRLIRLFHARLPNGESGATQLVLAGEHEVTHTVCAGADERHLALGCSPFLRWGVCAKLLKEGYRENDLTDASLNSVSRFKSQLGAELQTCFVLNITPSAALRLRDRATRWTRAIRSSFSHPQGDEAS